MTTLVTGASGFLGTALVKALSARAVKPLRCMVRDDAGIERLRRMNTESGHAELSFVKGDLTRPADAKNAMDGVDVVFHLAAGTKGSPAELFQNTVVGSKNLLDVVGARELRKVILVSSFGVYGVSDLASGALIDEGTAVEEHPEKRDPYSYSKWRQEKLFWEYRERYRFPLVVLRPGVIYGPGGAAMSSRVGISVFGLFLHLGGSNLLPLTYVDNCADAICVAAGHERSDGEVYNVVDDDLPTSKQFLTRYRRRVRPIKYLRVPYPALRTISGWVERYHVYSKGQLPPVLTPYKSACLWKGNSFDNSKLKGIGWRPGVTTDEGVARFLTYLRENGHR